MMRVTSSALTLSRERNVILGTMYGPVTTGPPRQVDTVLSHGLMEKMAAAKSVRKSFAEQCDDAMARRSPEPSTAVKPARGSESPMSTREGMGKIRRSKYSLKAA